MVKKNFERNFERKTVKFSTHQYPWVTKAIREIKNDDLIGLDLYRDSGRLSIRTTLGTDLNGFNAFRYGDNPQTEKGEKIQIRPKTSRKILRSILDMILSDYGEHIVQCYYETQKFITLFFSSPDIEKKFISFLRENYSEVLDIQEIETSQNTEK